MRKNELTEGIRCRFKMLSGTWNERQRRHWAASEARAVGYGGVSLVASVTGVSRRAIHVGLAELSDNSFVGRVHKPGAGRKRLTTTQLGLLAALDVLVEPASRGDPETPLRWTCESVRRLAAGLRRQGYPVSHQGVAELLRHAGYSLQANRKTIEGNQHQGRNAQLEYIARQVRSAQRRGKPVISVDTKRKELVGYIRNFGREWRPKGEPA